MLKKIINLSITISFLLTSSSSAFAASILPFCLPRPNNPALCGKKNISFPLYRANKKTGLAKFKYKVDPGSIGDISASSAQEITDDILSLWQNESSIFFEKVGGGLIETDVNGSNYQRFLSTQSSLGYSPVVWDDDGSITDLIFGAGSKQSVLGFAGATFLRQDSSSGKITGIAESQAILNGFLFSEANTGDSFSTILNAFKTTILHEFAHMFGIDHTQGGDLEAYNQGGNRSNIPVMFPFAANEEEELQQDDIAAIRRAYPKGDEDRLFGSISGSLNSSTQGITAANIVAYKIDDAAPRARAVACPADFNGKKKGRFLLPALIPGQYIVYFEPIDPDFAGSSSIGIHAPGDRPNTDLNIKGFYNGDSMTVVESPDLDEGINRAAIINVEAGQRTEIDINLFGSSAGSGSDKYIASGNLLTAAILLNFSSKKTVNLKFVNINPGKRLRVSFSTEYPELIKFKQSRINTRNRTKKVSVKIASYLRFLEDFPELQNQETVEIPLTITNLDTNEVDTSNTIVVF